MSNTVNHSREASRKVNLCRVLGVSCPWQRLANRCRRDGSGSLEEWWNVSDSTICCGVNIFPPPRICGTLRGWKAHLKGISLSEVFLYTKPTLSKLTEPNLSPEVSVWSFRCSPLVPIKQVGHKLLLYVLLFFLCLKGAYVNFDSWHLTKQSKPPGETFPLRSSFW